MEFPRAARGFWMRMHLACDLGQLRYGSGACAISNCRPPSTSSYPPPGMDGQGAVSVGRRTNSPRTLPLAIKRRTHLWHVPIGDGILSEFMSRVNSQDAVPVGRQAHSPSTTPLAPKQCTKCTTNRFPEPSTKTTLSSVTTDLSSRFAEAAHPVGAWSTIDDEEMLMQSIYAILSVAEEGETLRQAEASIARERATVLLLRSACASSVQSDRPPQGSTSVIPRSENARAANDIPLTAAARKAFLAPDQQPPARRIQRHHAANLPDNAVTPPSSADETDWRRVCLPLAAQSSLLAKSLQIPNSPTTEATGDLYQSAKWQERRRQIRRQMNSQMHQETPESTAHMYQLQRRWLEQECACLHCQEQQVVHWRPQLIDFKRLPAQRKRPSGHPAHAGAEVGCVSQGRGAQLASALRRVCSAPAAMRLDQASGSKLPATLNC